MTNKEETYRGIPISELGEKTRRAYFEEKNMMSKSIIPVNTIYEDYIIFAVEETNTTYSLTDSRGYVNVIPKGIVEPQVGDKLRIFLSNSNKVRGISVVDNLVYFRNDEEQSTFEMQQIMETFVDDLVSTSDICSDCGCKEGLHIQEENRCLNHPKCTWVVKE